MNETCVASVRSRMYWKIKCVACLCLLLTLYTSCLVMPRELVGGYQCFRGTCYLNLQDLRTLMSTFKFMWCWFSSIFTLCYSLVWHLSSCGALRLVSLYLNMTSTRFMWSQLPFPVTVNVWYLWVVLMTVTSLCGILKKKKCCVVITNQWYHHQQHNEFRYIIDISLIKKVVPSCKFF